MGISRAVGGRGPVCSWQQSIGAAGEKRLTSPAPLQGRRGSAWHPRREPWSQGGRAVDGAGSSRRHRRHSFFSE